MNNIRPTMAAFIDSELPTLNSESEVKKSAIKNQKSDICMLWESGDR